MNAIAEHPAPFARILDVTEEQYHADPCEVPSLSQSIAHILLTKSPLHAWTAHPKLGGAQLESGDEDDTPPKQAGKVIHKLLLGKGPEIALLAADNWRLKASQEWKKAALAEGKVPMLARVYDEIVASVETIKGNLALFGYELTGQSEVAVEWDEHGEHGPVRCRGMMDHVIFERGKIYDVKKIISAHPETCGKHTCDYGYYIQDAAYTSAFEKLRPEFAGRVQVEYLFVEVEPPYAIYPAPLDGELRDLGRRYWERAVLVWERCLRRNDWPAYVKPDKPVNPIMAPGWHSRRLLEAAELW
jgi:hypothetical protein